MTQAFDPGYGAGVFADLVGDAPGAETYPSDAFRVEWGPIFHRGRLDGSARVLVVGQDPAAHEAICRRILVGEAGQRLQGLLAKLGVDRSYVLVNTFLYSVFGQQGGERHIGDAGIADYRNRWLDAISAAADLQAIISLGHLADKAYQAWKATPAGGACIAAYATVLHPTYPESASRGGKITKAAALARLCVSWNAALDALGPAITPDTPVPLVHYGKAIAADELRPIPAADLPAGVPAWMGGLAAWAARKGSDAQTKRATIVVSVPRGARPWPPLA
jgi:hypothetical protein